MLYAGIGTAAISLPFTSLKTALSIGLGFSIALGILGLSIMFTLWLIDIGIWGAKSVFNLINSYLNKSKFNSIVQMVFDDVEKDGNLSIKEKAEKIYSEVSK